MHLLVQSHNFSLWRFTNSLIGVTDLHPWSRGPAELGPEMPAAEAHRPIIFALATCSIMFADAANEIGPSIVYLFGTDIVAAARDFLKTHSPYCLSPFVPGQRAMTRVVNVQ